MGAIAPIKLSSNLDVADSAVAVGTTASDTTMSPDGTMPNGVTRWVDRSGGIALGYPNITMSIRKPNKGSRIFRVMFKIVHPVLEVTSPSTATGIQPAPTLAYNLTSNIEFLLPERATRAERMKLYSYVRSMFVSHLEATTGGGTEVTGSPLIAAIQDLEDVY